MRSRFDTNQEGQGKARQWLSQGEHPQEDELAVFEQFVGRDSVFLDIGANIGTVSVPMAQKVKEVLAFEPVPENVELLRENIRLNGVPNARVFPLALGSEEGSVSLQTESGDTGSFSVRGEGDTPMVTLDSLHTNPSFVKMDVEGHELEVLKGARETIERYKPVIWFEINLIESRKRGDWWLTRVQSELKAQGYDIYLLSRGRRARVRSVAWELFRHAPKAFIGGKLHYNLNFLALHRASPFIR
jgi:FkbM family methyltransferase